MTKDELIKERDECANLVAKYSKIKKKFVFYFPIALVISLILLIVDASLFNANSGGDAVKPAYYYPLLWTALSIFLFGVIMLSIYLTFYFIEKKYQRKRDLASNRLLGLSLSKKDN